MFFNCGGATSGGSGSNPTGNAQAQDVLVNKTFSNNSLVGAVGTMPDKTGWSQTVTENGQVSIPKGYHNGNGKVTVNTTSFRIGSKTVTINGSSFILRNVGEYAYKLSESDGLPTGFNIIGAGSLEMVTTADTGVPKIWMLPPIRFEAETNSNNELVFRCAGSSGTNFLNDSARTTVTVKVVYTYQ